MGEVLLRGSCLYGAGSYLVRGEDVSLGLCSPHRDSSVPCLDETPPCALVKSDLFWFCFMLHCVSNTFWYAVWY